jgi:hypothetical protein
MGKTDERALRPGPARPGPARPLGISWGRCCGLFSCLRQRCVGLARAAPPSSLPTATTTTQHHTPLSWTGVHPKPPPPSTTPLCRGQACTLNRHHPAPQRRHHIARLGCLRGAWPGRGEVGLVDPGHPPGPGESGAAVDHRPMGIGADGLLGARGEVREVNRRGSMYVRGVNRPRCPRRGLPVSGTQEQPMLGLPEHRSRPCCLGLPEHRSRPCRLGLPLHRSRPCCLGLPEHRNRPQEQTIGTDHRNRP